MVNVQCMDHSQSWIPQLDMTRLPWTLHRYHVPAQLTVQPSLIPGAGLEVFSTTFISKGVRIGPYKGEIVDKDDVEGLHHTANVGEVRNGVFLCMKTESKIVCYLWEIRSGLTDNFLSLTELLFNNK